MRTTSLHSLVACSAFLCLAGCRHQPKSTPATRPGADARSSDAEFRHPAEPLQRAWDQFPIVALGERHGVKEHGAFLDSLISDTEVMKDVNDVVVEFGSSDHQAVMDRYVAGDAVSTTEIELVLRDTTQIVVWDLPIYAKVLAAVRRANLRRPASRRLRVLLADPPIDWSTIQTSGDYRKIADERDRHFATVIEREVLSKARKALLLVGAYHALKRGALRGSVVSMLEERHPGSTFVVMLYYGLGPYSARIESALSARPTPTIVSLQRSWIGSLNARSAFPLPPVLQLPEELNLRDIADAYLYLGTASSLTEDTPPTAAYRDEPYLRELERRHLLIFGAPLDTQKLLAPER